MNIANDKALRDEANHSISFDVGQLIDIRIWFYQNETIKYKLNFIAVVFKTNEIEKGVFRCYSPDRLLTRMGVVIYPVGQNKLFLRIKSI